MMAVPTISSSEVPDFCCWEDGWATRDTTEYESSSREVIADDEGARTDEMDSYLGDVVRKSGDEEEEEGVLYIGGIFELTNNPHSASPRSELDAALLAIRHVNEQRIVPGYRLHLVYNDSKCDAGVGTDVFYDMIYRMPPGRRITMVMGSSCTEVSKTLAEIAPYWNLVLISYGETSPALGDREKYKTFFRLALADSALVPARRMFIRNFGWKTVAVLYEDNEMFSLAMNDIGEDLGIHNISVAASLSFKDATVEIKEKLQEIKEMDLRVIIAAFAESTARQVFCEAYHEKLTGPRYVWLLVGSFSYPWWLDAQGTRCTAEQLTKALDGCFAVGSLNTLLGGETSVANLTSAEFKQAYIDNNGSNPMSFFAATTYDTVWTIALTLRAVVTQRRQSSQPLTPLTPLHEMNYSDLEEIRDMYLNIIENMHFLGVSGPVSFKGSDREGISVIYQLQDGNSSRVAIHYPGSTELDFSCDECYQIVWQGGRIPATERQK
ncbi:gamma-aminobutyric acid type B receptor subunit 1-like [Pomacea canaliculata]|uniref:gamma-aminobutyric acid type B receptor subunit 1-like n=1 Tax=Pomacea canaliculata TaxID=400727 RepID=UPI000D7257B2|nr:gamma-aminobutyric acid type B receptor subunit 1-like [Pomacea canaliculata]